jgi:hypothetical protein
MPKTNNIDKYLKNKEDIFSKVICLKHLGCGEYTSLNNGMYFVIIKNGLIYLFINFLIYIELHNSFEDLPKFDVCFTIHLESWKPTPEDLTHCNRMIYDHTKNNTIITRNDPNGNCRKRKLSKLV